jgi:hypothetical protein
VTRQDIGTDLNRIVPRFINPRRPRRSGGPMRLQSYWTDVREECWVWHC